MQNVFIILIIWLLAAVFYAFQYILRVLPSLMINDILVKFGIDADIFGQYSGLYYIGYAFAHLPLGIALDRFGTKKVLPICVLITISGLLPLLYCSHWLYPCIGRVLLGIGSSAAILGLFKVILYCFGEAKFTRMLGISVAIGLCGAIFGGTPVSMLITAFGWQFVLKAAIVVGLILAVALYMLLPDQDAKELSATNGRTSMWQDLKLLATNPQFLLLCCLAGLMVGPLEGFADVWGAEFFRTAYGLNKVTADGLPSFIFWGMLIGSPLLSYICDRQNKYFEVVICAGLIMGICFSLMLIGVLPVYALYLNLLVIGIFCAYQIPAIFKISTYLPANMMGIATASVNMFIMLFGYMFHSVIGKVMASVASGALIDGIHVYSHTDFIKGLSVIPLAQFVAAIGFTFVILIHRAKSSVLSNTYIRAKSVIS
jgi:predicted MFS family arabinose efflux permease